MVYRLWAAAGQQALESANLLVVNGSSTATQILKNLVLPGIGQFSILDDKITDEADIGSNFFLARKSLGKQRAAEEVELLCEMNDSVKGSHIQQTLDKFLSRDAALSNFTLVVSVNAPFQKTVQLAQRCWDEGIPLITVRTSGFVASMRTQVGEVAFVETHPDSLVDLRLDAPFPALLQYAMGLDVKSMDSAEHGHMPAVAIVIRALEEYNEKNDGRLPKLTKDRNALKALITAQKRSVDEENFDEANSLVIKLAKTSKIPDEISALFQDPAIENLTSASAPFWILLRAVRDFVAADSQHLLPLTGALPDMKATSAGYLHLQHIYRNKAQQDLSAVKSHLSEILKTLDLPPGAISDEQIATFVKHAAHLAVIRGACLADEIKGTALTGAHGKGKSPETILNELDDEESVLSWHFALRSAEEFEAEHSHWPGQTDDTVEADFGKLQTKFREIASRYGLSIKAGEEPDLIDKCLKEICRAADGELPQISALIGGIVAQEAIKLVTRQYIALNGTLIFDGIKSRTGVVAL